MSLVKRTGRSVQVLARTRSLSLTAHAARSRDSARVLSALRRGVVLQLAGNTVEVHYRGAAIPLPLGWLRKVGNLADMLDAGYQIAQDSAGVWRLDIPNGPSFHLDHRSLASDLSTVYQRFYEDEYKALDV